MKATPIWFLAIWFLLTTGTAAAAGPELAVDPPSFDWSTISPGERLERQFSLINTGDADLVIEAVSTSCHCLSASLAAKVLSPGETATLDVVFDSTGESGGFLGFVVLRTNDPLRPLRRIEIKGRIGTQPAEGHETETKQEVKVGSAEEEAFLPHEASTPPSPVSPPRVFRQEQEEVQPVSPPTMPPEKEKKPEKSRRILFFYSAHCPDCLAVKDRFLPAFLRRHPEAEIVSYDLDTAKGYLALLGAEESLGRPIAAAPPFMIIGRRLLVGREEIEKYAEEALGQGQTTAMPAPVGAEKAAAELRRLRLPAVVLGGLLDGINSCAFATLVFLLIR
ncbi:MAG: DUF1573 domain-containing protein [Bacillota bacterium]